MANTRTRRLNHRHTLGEIPTFSAFETLDRSILGNALIDSPVNNIQIPLSFLSPQLSPDEQIIQLRGRRKISWSPRTDSFSSGLSPLKTPTKKLSAMQLRSSPRKRLMPDFSEETPEKEKRATPQKPSSTTKRIRFEESNNARLNMDVPLSKLLKGMSQDQLINVILGAVRQEPYLEEQLRLNLPAPDLKPMEDRLNLLKKNITKSLPKTRLVSKTDTASFSRASAHLDAFKKCLLDQVKLLCESAHYNALVDYILLSWSYVKALPVFDNSSHNTVRRTCFKLLAQYLGISLKQGGTFLGEKRLFELKARLKTMTMEYNDLELQKVAVEELLNNVFVNKT